MPHFTEDSPQRIMINPLCAMSVAQSLTVEHEPAMSEAEWMQLNVTQIRNMGAESWLRQLLHVLGGDIVTAEGVGFEPPGGTFGYGGPGRLSARRRGKKQRKKRRHA